MKANPERSGREGFGRAHAGIRFLNNAEGAISVPTDDAFSEDVPVIQNMTSTNQQAWVKTLPALVDEFEQRWGVTTESPFRSGTSAWVAKGRTADGRPVVLKIAWPHREADGEALALQFWDGEGAIQVLSYDREKYALLLEACVPGQSLSDVGLSSTEALTAAAESLARLWSKEPPVDLDLEPLTVVMKDWANESRSAVERFSPPIDLAVVNDGLGLLESLAARPSRTVVLHGDFNPSNLLRAERQPWLAIDAKPMVGDAGFDVEPLISQIGSPYEGDDAEKVLLDRYELVAQITGEPRERLLAWAFARTTVLACWSVEDGLDAKPTMERAALLGRLANR